MPEQRPLLALGLRLISAFLIATMFMLGKRAAESGVALPEVLFWRQGVGLPLMAGWLAMRGELGQLRTDRLGSHVRRAAMGMVGMFANFGAVILLPLAEATTLNFTTPLFAVVISGLFLRDRVGPWRWTAVALGFVGVLIITQPGHSPFPPLGVAVGLLSALSVAIISFQIRDLGRTERPVTVVFYFSLFGTLLTALMLPFVAAAHSAEQYALLIAMGLAGFAGQIFLTTALRLGPVASVIIMDYSALIWATLYGLVIWNDMPPATTWLGAPLIVLAGIVIAWREATLARRARTGELPSA